MATLSKLTLLSALLLAPLACGPAEVGEECDDIGDDDECEDGAICTNIDDGPRGYCAWICENDSHCPAEFDCRDVRGSSAESCQPE